MEELALKLRMFLKQFQEAMTPHFRQCIRFFLLPYCYLFLVNWDQCTRSRLEVLGDFLYIFFVLRYFPDNYSPCHLHELPRSEWAYYYGSGYNPYQRGSLGRRLQPSQFHILFEDKQVCQHLCEGLGLAVPHCHGVLQPDLPIADQVRRLVKGVSAPRLLAKPVSGASGRGILLVELGGPDPVVSSSLGPVGLDDLTLEERYVVQDLVPQHEALSRVYPHSTNSLRILTALGPDHRARVLSVLIRFGASGSFVDNWSAGGVAAGVDVETGVLFQIAYDKHGRGYDRHPDTGVAMSEVRVPEWKHLVSFARSVQEAFPYYRMLGLDVCVGPERPVLLEINACPDLIMQEQTSGPLLRNRAALDILGHYDALFNREQRRLYGERAKTQ